MTKGIKEGMQDVERAVEVMDEEAMIGRMHGQALVNAAEEESLDSRIAHMKKEATRSVIVAAVLVVTFAVIVIARLVLGV